MELKNKEFENEVFVNWNDENKNVFIAESIGIDTERVLLNGEVDKRIVASKYMPLSRFVNAVQSKKFTFLSPLLWLDPFETLLYKPMVQIDQETYHINACCFAGNDIQNEEGFWNIWGNGSNEPIVRVTYDMSKLLRALSTQANENIVFYLGAIKYLTRHEILQKSKNGSNKTYSSISDYLSDCLLKRDAYSYEIELRLFAVTCGGRGKDILDVDEIDYTTGIVTDVTMPPLEPLGNSHPSLCMYKCMQDCVNLNVKQKIERLNLCCDIKQSALYCTDIVARSY
jgi:hypothetical protein